jgi:hypothetical protein
MLSGADIIIIICLCGLFIESFLSTILDFIAMKREPVERQEVSKRIYETTVLVNNLIDRESNKKKRSHALLNSEYMGLKNSPCIDEMVEVFAQGQNVLENPIMLYLVELNLWKNPYLSKLKSKERFFFNIKQAIPKPLKP